MDIFKIADNEKGLSNDEIAKLLEQSLEGRTLKNVLVIPPDFTRFHSNAGFITQVYYKLLTERGVQVASFPRLARTCRFPRRNGRRCSATSPIPR